MQMEDGHPAAEIVRVAEEGGYDLIVAGSRGRNPVGELLLGSVSQAVVRQASCPVLVVTKDAEQRFEPYVGRVKITSRLSCSYAVKRCSACAATNIAWPSTRSISSSSTWSVPGALEDDVDLVVLVRLLAVGLRRDEHVHADLEPGRRVDDLVAAAPLLQPALRRLDVEEVLVDPAHQAAARTAGMIVLAVGPQDVLLAVGHQVDVEVVDADRLELLELGGDRVGARR